MEYANPWLLIYIGLIFILLELIIGIQTGFDLVLIGAALMVGGFVGNILGNFLVGITTTITITILYIFFGRQFIKHKLYIGAKHTNIDSVVGKRGMVTQEITPHKAGRINVDGETWRASSTSTLGKGTDVIIEKITGVTAHVVKYH